MTVPTTLMMMMLTGQRLLWPVESRRRSCRAWLQIVRTWLQWTPRMRSDTTLRWLIDILSFLTPKPVSLVYYDNLGKLCSSYAVAALSSTPNGQAPWYSGWWLLPRRRVSSQKTIRSTDTRTLPSSVKRAPSSATEPSVLQDGRLWNNLQMDFRQSDLSYGRCRQLLKTFLFGQYDCSAVLIAPV